MEEGASEEIPPESAAEDAGEDEAAAKQDEAGAPADEEGSRQEETAAVNEDDAAAEEEPATAEEDSVEAQGMKQQEAWDPKPREILSINDALLQVQMRRDARKSATTPDKEKLTEMEALLKQANDRRKESTESRIALRLRTGIAGMEQRELLVFPSDSVTKAIAAELSPALGTHERIRGIRCGDEPIESGTFEENGVEEGAWLDVSVTADREPKPGDLLQIAPEDYIKGDLPESAFRLWSIPFFSAENGVEIEVVAYSSDTTVATINVSIGGGCKASDVATKIEKGRIEANISIYSYQQKGTNNEARSIAWLPYSHVS